MNQLPQSAIFARTFIYALDPNRHLLADIPFLDFLVHLVRISARPEGLPVPEACLLSARHQCLEDAFWRAIADECLSSVHGAEPPIPSNVPADPEEVWRKRCFTYPAGRYAILRCGEVLARVATSPQPALCRNRKHFRDSANPWDRAVARAITDSSPVSRGFRMSLGTWILREKIRSGKSSAFQTALAAACLTPQKRPKKP